MERVQHPAAPCLSRPMMGFNCLCLQQHVPLPCPDEDTHTRTCTHIRAHINARRRTYTCACFDHTMQNRTSLIHTRPHAHTHTLQVLPKHSHGVGGLEVFESGHQRPWRARGTAGSGGTARCGIWRNRDVKERIDIFGGWGSSGRLLICLVYC